MSIFRHVEHILCVAGCYLWMVGQVGKKYGLLFLDIWIMVYELQDAICGWLVKLVKTDGPLFLDILGRVYF